MGRHDVDVMGFLFFVLILVVGSLLSEKIRFLRDVNVIVVPVKKAHFNSINKKSIKSGHSNKMRRQKKLYTLFVNQKISE